ncbi:hypothetical protein F4802DRAFT_592052 [Xylaria palmicola]|nr:hypothetical protein F4802DRAFT_592052 [Xylaria palmicola]
MRLLKRLKDGIVRLSDHPADDIPAYAILSHTWPIGGSSVVADIDINVGNATDVRVPQSIRIPSAVPILSGVFIQADGIAPQADQQPLGLRKGTRMKRKTTTRKLDVCVSSFKVHGWGFAYEFQGPTQPGRLRAPNSSSRSYRESTRKSTAVGELCISFCPSWA